MLQDNVPGFSFEGAKKILEEDLGQPLEELYDSFSTVPLAAASLGQVSRPTSISRWSVASPFCFVFSLIYCGGATRAGSSEKGDAGLLALKKYIYIV